MVLLLVECHTRVWILVSTVKRVEITCFLCFLLCLCSWYSWLESFSGPGLSLCRGMQLFILFVSLSMEGHCCYYLMIPKFIFYILIKH